MSDKSTTSDTLNDFEAEKVDARRVVVLISGNGSNLQALIDAQSFDELGGEIVAVISNKADAHGLQRARDAGIDAVVLPHDEYESRDAFDGALIKVIERHEPDLVVLAGFMRILTPRFVHRFHGRLLNIHPSLLPAYRGLDTHKRVLADGGEEHGASVHFVTEELDGGPVVMQAALKIRPGDSEESVVERIHAREHLIYPIAVRWFLEGRLQLGPDGPTLDGMALPPQGMRLSHEDAAEELDEDLDG
ncbi:formyltetrahydrofolate-dependent phosphoribosylglycinamide formyltransferase [Modicisalibacter ilicicola DSM 19980]|uniref:Phosphoribosylglycinamide formyltransferase n=1 Tax=Modicisalibacter ilicicola DSM 19980 TaxID=1121942 RepID=A0A1M4Z887_9GAMM|nr:phosphoribosylglycinamide formyltransferase [Halomonas ilicicola]SHF14283.1 formyltetrahydrofolate-dependent phosphoribosylglycinamide formyltransferase [Halomonas ilicicola DSM 19980]